MTNATKAVCSTLGRSFPETPGPGADTHAETAMRPGEYRTQDGFSPQPDGGTLLVDLGNARLTRIEGASASVKRGRPHTKPQLRGWR